MRCGQAPARTPDRHLPHAPIEPCLPRRADKPPAGRDWIHKIKHDGFRDAAGVRLLTQKGVFSLVSAGIILAVLAYREGWEAVLFVLTFLAIRQLATIEPSGDF